MRIACCVLALAGIALAGCSALPTSGPSASAVLEGPDGESAAEARYSVVEVNESVVRALRSRSPERSLASFGGYQGGASDLRVGVGDTVSLTIWEAGAGGLFSSSPVALGAGGSVSAGSRAASVPEQIVGRDGMITVPYAGRIHAAGRSPAQIQRQIEIALSGKAIQPQALVTVPRAVSNSVTVVGDAVAGARVPLSPKGDRVLDIIAQAGGTRSAAADTVVQVSRGGSTARVSMARISANARENIYLRPGDVVSVIRDPQYFMAYGATGRSADINFDGEDLTLALAITKAGGLLDYRADPEGVFVFRLENRSVAAALGVDTPQARMGDRVKVVYHFNFRDPNGLFLAQQMRIAHRDLVYVSNAKLTEVQKFMQLFNMITAPVSQGVGIASGVTTLSR